FICNHTVPPAIYTLSLHDALPISHRRTVAAREGVGRSLARARRDGGAGRAGAPRDVARAARCARSAARAVGPGDRRALLLDRRRSEEHTSELQSRSDLVCRLLLEK